MSELKEFASFITLNMANLAATYAQLLADSNAGYQNFSTDSRVTSGRKLLKAIAEVFNSKTSDPLLQRFVNNKNEEYLRWAEHIDPPQPLIEIECLGQTLTPVVTNLEAGKYLWQILAEVRNVLLQSISASSVAFSKDNVRPVNIKQEPAPALDVVKDARFESETRYKTILENIEDGYYEVDLAGNLTFFNNSLSKVLGYPADKLLGMNNRDYTDEENARKLYQTFNQVYKTGKPVKGFIWEVTRQDGTKGLIETSTSLIISTSDEAVGFRGLARDITERLRIDRALRVRTQAMDASIEPMTIADARQPDLPLIYVNPAFERITGYSANEVLGRNCRFLQRDDRDQPALNELRAALKEGRGCVVTLRNYRKDGTLFWNELHISPILDDQGQVLYFLGSQNDITEAKQAQEALNEREERLRTLLQVSPDAIVTYNPTGQVTYLNPAFEALFGWTQEELLGKRIDFVPEENLAETKAALEQLFSSGTVRSFETKRLTKAGNLVDVDQSGALLTDKDGNVEGSIIFIRDITERKKIEDSLRASEDRYRTLLEESPDPIVMYDIEGKTTYINPSFTRVFGWTADEVLGQQVDFVPEESKPETQTAVKTVFERGRVSLESKRLTKDGQILDAWGTASMLKDDDGNPAGMLTILRDITERKQVAEEREKLLAETQVLYRISQALSQVSDQRKMAESVLTEYLQILELPQGGVMLFDDNQTEGTLIGLMQGGTLIEPGMRIPIIGNPACEQMIDTKAPVVIVDALTDPILEPVRDFVYELGYKSLLLVPIIIQNEVVGALGADSVDKIYEFTDREIDLVQTIADRLGAALENQRLFDEAQRRARREQTIREITEKMRAATSLEELVKTTAKELGQKLSAGHAVVDLGIESIGRGPELEDSSNGNHQPKSGAHLGTEELP